MIIYTKYTGGIRITSMPLQRLCLQVEVSDRGKLSGYDRGMVKVRLGINPIVTLENSY